MYNFNVHSKPSLLFKVQLCNSTVGNPVQRARHFLDLYFIQFRCTWAAWRPLSTNICNFLLGNQILFPLPCLLASCVEPTLSAVHLALATWPPLRGDILTLLIQLNSHCSFTVPHICSRWATLSFWTFTRKLFVIKSAKAERLFGQSGSLRLSQSENWEN